MGYRCPICFKDFGKDKDAWEKHCEKEHYGAGKVMVKGVVNIAEDKNER